MKTTSVMIQSLCVPCCNRCRHCLLSWNGRAEGAEWSRSVRLAERFLGELRESRPDLNCAFSFGYSMEHPDLREALRTLRRLGSPTADFLQCDGMKLRDEAQCAELMRLLREEGVIARRCRAYGTEPPEEEYAKARGITRREYHPGVGVLRTTHGAPRLSLTPPVLAYPSPAAGADTEWFLKQYKETHGLL